MLCLMPQSLARILLHLIFSTKNREPNFADPVYRREVHAYLAATASRLACPAICIGGVADHVHVVCSLGRSLSVAIIVAKLKVSSNQAVRESSRRRPILSRLALRGGRVITQPSVTRFLPPLQGGSVRKCKPRLKPGLCFQGPSGRRSVPK